MLHLIDTLLVKQMDSIDVNNHRVLIDSVSPVNSISTEGSSNSGVYGEPEMLPRVGDQYQVEIPSLISVSDYINLVDSLDRVDNAESSNSLVDKSIPLMWINEEAANEDGLSVKGCRLVPGWSNSGDKWSEIEESGFLLGLYVFGKNLGLVKDLIRSKQMGDILPYYYGRFFCGEGYRRWSECRKMKSNKKYVYGERIFSRSRHQELLSRLLRDVSEECRNDVVEMSKAFGEGRLTLEEYVFSLEAKLGLRAIVDAMGIGKGKQDLTRNVAETTRHHNTRREIPAGKPLTALTPNEIISILTGDFRLSKAKTGDLFWESVWPRLLARGWHSEQPNKSSNSLVYLVPGISKFSRSELVRGEGYYDSVTDILNLVVSKPEILEIEGFTEEAGKNGWVEEAKSERRREEDNDGNDIDNERQRRRYLKPPRTPNRGGCKDDDDGDDSMKFMVVDTSRYSNGKVREIRSLPSKSLEWMGFSVEEGEDGDSSEALKTRRTEDRRQTLLALPAHNSLLAKKRTKTKPSLLENVAKQHKKSPLSSSGDSGLLQQETSPELGVTNNVIEPLQETVTSGVAEKALCVANSVVEPPQETTTSGIAEKVASPPPPRKTFIDLNALPASHQTVEIDQVFIMGSEETRRDGNDDEKVAPEKYPEPVTGPQRRHSTRSRPPTAKALEAIAYGSMDVKQKKKRKAKDDSRGDNVKPRTRRARPPPPPQESFNPTVVIDAVDFTSEETESSSVHNADNGDVSNKQPGLTSQTG